MNPNPRLTNYISTTHDQNNLIKILSQIRQLDNLTVHSILCKYIQSPIIKDQPQFIQILFQKHLPLIIQMIEWLLTPKQIAKRKKIKSNMDFFPYRCKQFMKDNIPFYQHLYLYAQNNKLSITIWFNFLRKQYYDKETILTALGYFAQVFIPFAKYQFSASMNITHCVGFTNLSGLAQNNQKIQTMSIMKILPKSLIDQLITYSHYQPIFQFIKTSILISIQDHNDYQISKITMLKMLQNAQTINIFQKLIKIHKDNTSQINNKIQLLENVSLCLKELVANIQHGNDLQFRTQSLISIFLDSNMIPYTVNQILHSRFCQSYVTIQDTKSAVFGLNFQNLGDTSLNMSAISVMSLRQTSNSPKGIINLLSSCEQQQLMQILLSILIYSIPKTVPNIKRNMQQMYLKQHREVNYRKLVKNFRQQLQNMLNSLQNMTKIVYTQSLTTTITKPIPFSSGQKIKPISFIKFQYLKLLQKSLLLLQTKDIPESPPSQIKSAVKNLNLISYAAFEINFQKIHFIEIIKKYLNQNRWNNIVHHVLQKICHSLIICSTEYLSKNIEKDKNKKLTQGFLAFLIQNFTQRDYIFLNTFKFTTQGNLHSLYKIAKDLAYTLNSTNQLSILLKQFQPWNKFLMNDLKVYQQKVYPVSIKPEGSDKGDQVTYNQVSGLKVDEADTIKKLIQNISAARKWPTKISRQKGHSKSGIYVTQLTKNNDRPQSHQPPLAKSHNFYTKNKKQPITTNNLTLNLINLYKSKGKQQQQSIQLTASQLDQMNISQDISQKQLNHPKNYIIEKQKKLQIYQLFKNHYVSFKFDKKQKQKKI